MLEAVVLGSDLVRCNERLGFSLFHDFLTFFSVQGRKVGIWDPGARNRVSRVTEQFVRQ